MTTPKTAAPLGLSQGVRRAINGALGGAGLGAATGAMTAGKGHRLHGALVGGGIGGLGGAAATAAMGNAYVPAGRPDHPRLGPDSDLPPHLRHIVNEHLHLQDAYTGAGTAHAKHTTGEALDAMESLMEHMPGLSEARNQRAAARAPSPESPLPMFGYKPIEKQSSAIAKGMRLIAAAGSKLGIPGVGHPSMLAPGVLDAYEHATRTNQAKWLFDKGKQFKVDKYLRPAPSPLYKPGERDMLGERDLHNMTQRPLHTLSGQVSASVLAAGALTPHFGTAAGYLGGAVAGQAAGYARNGIAEAVSKALKIPPPAMYRPSAGVAAAMAAGVAPPAATALTAETLGNALAPLRAEMPSKALQMTSAGRTPQPKAPVKNQLPRGKRAT